MNINGITESRNINTIKIESRIIQHKISHPSDKALSQNSFVDLSHVFNGQDDYRCDISEDTFIL